MGASNGQGLASPLGARDPLGRFPPSVPNVSRRFISCSRQSTDRTQRTPDNLLDEFRWARAFRRCRCRVDFLAIAYLSDLRDVRCEPDSDRVSRRSEMTRICIADAGAPMRRGALCAMLVGPGYRS